MQIDLAKNRIEVRTQSDEGLPLVEGDEVQLQQVVLKVVINAMESMYSLQPRILKLRSDQNKPGMVHLSIEDTGT
jgi:C4-dicarboxylate-specific signal transduction histidine kinase